MIDRSWREIQLAILQELLLPRRRAAVLALGRLLASAVLEGEGASFRRFGPRDAIFLEKLHTALLPFRDFSIAALRLVLLLLLAVLGAIVVVAGRLDLERLITGLT